MLIMTTKPITNIHVQKSDLCKECPGGAERTWRDVNTPKEQEHLMFGAQCLTCQFHRASALSGRDPHVPVCVWGFGIGNVPNPRPIWKKTNTLRMYNIYLNRVAENSLTGRDLCTCVLECVDCEEPFWNRPQTNHVFSEDSG